MGLVRGSCLTEIDFSAIEAVCVGWFARDPDYIRLAKMGVHSGLASHILERPFDPTWLRDRPSDLKAYLKEIKKIAQATPVGKSELYDVSKRTVHGSSYLLTPYGMNQNFPEVFQTVAIARKYQLIYYAMAPSVPTWQTTVQKFAYDHGYLGGPGDPPFGHPFGYKHWFWAVGTFRKLTASAATKREAKGEPVVWIHDKPYAPVLGDDAKRGVAFYPQSTAAGILKEASLRLFDPEEAEPYNSYIGDAYFGRTPLRAPIHDSLFLELPWRIRDRVLEIVIREMCRPIVQMPNPVEWDLGDYLTIDVEAKVGQSWDAMQVIGDLPAQEAEPFVAALSEEEEEVGALQVEVA